MNRQLVLGSGSPRRRELMARAGFDFDVRTSDADESFDPSMPPVDVAPFLATQKAQAVYAELSDSEQGRTLVVGADTIVALGSTIYGKPVDEEDACRMLTELSGNTHQVITGVCIVAPEGTTAFSDVTDVCFRELSIEEIRDYVEGGEPMDKAGAYGIQGEGGKLVDHIVGDFDNVVGLPINRLAPILRELLDKE